MPIQNDDYDSGMYVCQYAVQLVELASEHFKMKDVLNDFDDYIGVGSSLDFEGKDVYKLRSEMRTIAMHIRTVYKNSRTDDGFELLPPSKLDMDGETNDDSDLMSIEEDNSSTSSSTEGGNSTTASDEYVPLDEEDYLDDTDSDDDCGKSCRVKPFTTLPDIHLILPTFLLLICACRC